MSSDPEIAWLLSGTDKPEPEMVTAAQLGSWLGLSSGRISQMARDGILPRADVPGGFGFPLKSAVRTYAEYLRNRAGQRTGSERLAAEKLRLAAASAEKIEIQNAKARGDLIPAAAVRAEWLTTAADLRSRLLGIAGRVAAALGLDRAGAAALDAEIRRAMLALSQTPPQTPQERGRTGESPTSGVTLPENVDAAQEAAE